MTRTGTAPVPPRPQGQRSKSGSADTGNFAQYTTASPSSATADLPADDAPPIPTAKRSMTASPSVFGMSSLGDGWATNVWHGRSGTGTSGSDGSQGAGPTAVGAGSAQRQGSVGPQDHDVAPGAGYTRSPLLPPESGAAWSNAARQAPGWPSNLASPSGDFALDPQPSPTATKSASVEAVSIAFTPLVSRWLRSPGVFLRCRSLALIPRKMFCDARLFSGATTSGRRRGCPSSGLARSRGSSHSHFKASRR